MTPFWKSSAQSSRCTRLGHFRTRLLSQLGAQGILMAELDCHCTQESEDQRRELEEDFQRLVESMAEIDAADSATGTTPQHRSR